MTEEDFDAGLRRLLGGEDTTGDHEDGGDSSGDSSGE